MQINKWFLLSLCLLIFTSCSHPYKKHRDHHEKMTKSLLIKNDWIKVQKIELAPGQSRHMHAGGPRLIVALTDYTIKFEEKGTQAFEKEWKRGDVHWHEAKMHSVKNVGQTAANFLILTRLGDLPSYDKTVHHHKSKSHKSLPSAVFENEWVKVGKATLKSGEQQPKHPGSIRAIIAMSDYEILYNSNCIKNRKTKFISDSVHLHDADEHSIKNVGATEAKFLIVQFKK